MENYRVRVSKDYLGFCAAHFIIFRKDQCERLHGHNYRVEAELEGTLDENYLVFDFIELKQTLMAICDELDHRMLVPVKSRQLSVETGEATVTLGFEDKEWVFPRTDCVLLPIENTTAEQLACYVAHRLSDALRERSPPVDDDLPNGTLTAGSLTAGSLTAGSLTAGSLTEEAKTGIHKVTIEMYEGPGQSARYSMDFSTSVPGT